MHPEPPRPPEETALIIRRESGLARLPAGGAPALEEIINRSLVQIRQSTALATPPRIAGEECEFEIVPGVKMVMCWIPPGEFLMGSLADGNLRLDCETQHRVKITQGFWLAKTQTTQAQWQAVMGNNPSRCQGEDLPVESMSWNDICGNESGTGGFLGKLNKLLPRGGRFHLPTEAQWEYACRAGTTGPYAGDLREMGWYNDNSKHETHPVGQKKPNAWGLHDMFGNVWEWCSDWYGDYDLSAVTDPTGPASGKYRVLRGGFSYYWDGGSCANDRDADYPTVRRSDNNSNCHADFGFRIARSSVP